MKNVTPHQQVKANIRQGVAVKYILRIRDGETNEVIQEFRPRKNLVMDSGLDKYASSPFTSLFQFACVGTGTNPVNRFSDPITFSQAGNVITSSAPFFQIGDVGYILKYGAAGSGAAGAEQYITTFTDSTHVVVNSSATVAPIVGCIWYVTQTTLQTQAKFTNTYNTSGSGSADSVSGSTVTRTYTRVFVFSAEVGTVTYNEIGWSWDSVNVFGRDLITPAGITLIATQVLEVTVQVALALSPAAVVSVGDVSGGTWDTSGTALIEFMGTQNLNDMQALGSLLANGSDGGSDGVPCLEAGQFHEMQLIQGAWTQRTTTLSGQNPNTNARDVISLTRASYTPGSFSMSASALIGIFSLNGITWTGIAISPGNPRWAWSLQLTTPNSKDSSHTLGFTFTIDWGRILVN